jgi:hypothetical protein
MLIQTFFFLRICAYPKKIFILYFFTYIYTNNNLGAPKRLVPRAAAPPEHSPEPLEVK